MKKDEVYKIIKADDISTLADIVTKALEEGWKLQGDIATLVHDYNDYYFYQAVTK